MRRAFFLSALSGLGPGIHCHHLLHVNYSWLRDPPRRGRFFMLNSSRNPQIDTVLYINYYYKIELKIEA